MNGSKMRKTTGGPKSWILHSFHILVQHHDMRKTHDFSALGTYKQQQPRFGHLAFCFPSTPCPLPLPFRSFLSFATMSDHFPNAMYFTIGDGANLSRVEGDQHNTYQIVRREEQETEFDDVSEPSCDQRQRSDLTSLGASGQEECDLQTPGCLL